MLTPEARSNPPGFVSVLLISPLADDHLSLRQIFDHWNWNLHIVSTCSEALAHTSQHESQVVICERELPDGDWKLLLNEFQSLPMPPTLIVTSRLADDRLWAEVLNLGAYDVLAQPFDSVEVKRVVFLAWHERWWRSRQRQGQS